MADTQKEQASAPTPTKTYHASCHCGAFAYDVSTSPLDNPACEVMECNCSICTRNGYLFIYAADGNVKFTKGDISELRKYQFGSKKMGHYFCGTCGASCVARSVDPTFFPGLTCVNVRMFEDVDLAAFRRKFGDGKNYNP